MPRRISHSQYGQIRFLPTRTAELRNPLSLMCRDKSLGVIFCGGDRLSQPEVLCAVMVRAVASASVSNDRYLIWEFLNLQSMPEGHCRQSS